jgi:hypothetical protein
MQFINIKQPKGIFCHMWVNFEQRNAHLFMGINLRFWLVSEYLPTYLCKDKTLILVSFTAITMTGTY